MSNLTTIDRLFYCKCAWCNFYNLDPRNLVVQFATNDRDSLTKHLKRAHAYILGLRTPYKDAGTFEFVYHNTPPSPGSTSASTTTSNATSLAIIAESAKEPNTEEARCLRSFRPRTVVTSNRCEQANAGFNSNTA